MKWLMENVQEVREAADKGHLMLGNIDAWLIWYKIASKKNGSAP